jgi:eukaryotic-like serine/threonine-protein kinase
LLLVFIVAIAGVALVLFLRRPQRLTERDSILLTDFVNTTGDPVFDSTLKEALAVQLGQSPFLNIVPDARVRETLAYMGRSPDERLTPLLAREVCQRQGVKAELAGSIASLGSHYVSSLDALNCQTGDSLAREQVEADSKEHVLAALGKVTTALRSRLGESLVSLQKFDKPLEQATTNSLNALKAFTIGEQLRNTSRELDAVPDFQRAIELDPNFALAYARLGTIYSNAGQEDVATPYMTKAYELRDRISERERLYILGHYYGLTGELDKSMEMWEQMRQTYPRDSTWGSNLSFKYVLEGQYDQGLQVAREQVKADPDESFSYQRMGEFYLLLQRPEEARAVLEQALARKLDTDSVRYALYRVALATGDAGLRRQEEDWTRDKPDLEIEFLAMQAEEATAHGHLRQAQEVGNRIIQVARQLGWKDAEGSAHALVAQCFALSGRPHEADLEATEALALSHNRRQVLVPSLMALAFAGADDKLRVVMAAAEQRYPVDTLLRERDLPVVQALQALHRGNGQEALQILQPASRFANFPPHLPYVRGLALLGAGRAADAVQQFQHVLELRYYLPASAYMTFAHLGLARAAVAAGQIPDARKYYQDYFALMESADPDIPILKQAKAEYAKLQ